MNSEYINQILFLLQRENKIQDFFYPIIMILREDKDGDIKYSLQDRDVVIQTPTAKELLRVAASTFLVEAEKLLKAINENNGAFAVPYIETFMNGIYCHSLKAIFILIQLPVSRKVPKVGIQRRQKQTTDGLEI